MKILFIGNSFSYDANVYLYNIAASVGFKLETLNLYIGGCSLERHAKNVKQNLCEYSVQYNGVDYPDKCTLEEGLRYRDWDYISVQQVSGLSGIYDTYYPHINVVLDKVRKVCPDAKILLHETWAYENDSKHSDFIKYNRSQDIMHKALKTVYMRVAKEIGAEMLVPCGDVFARLREYDVFNTQKGGTSLSRDGFHLSLDYGRYTAAATWFQKLGMGDIENNPFTPAADMQKIALIKRTVKEVCK